MNEVRSFYFKNDTSDFDLIDQFLILNGDIGLYYFIEHFVAKQAAVSHKDIFYHR